MIKRLVKYAFHCIGYDIHKYRHWPHLHQFFSSWKALGLDPKFVVDIGANHGQWTRAAQTYFPSASYLLIEPQEQLKIYSEDLLQSPNTKWMNVGMSDTSGRLMLTIPDRDDSATFRSSQEDENQADVHKVAVDVKTLNEIVKKEKRVPDLVKIDAEGFDLRVLRGASDLFGKTEVFFVECSICARDFENSLPAICNYMESKGYSPVDFTDLNRRDKDNTLWLCEIAFIRTTSELWRNVSSY